MVESSEEAAGKASLGSGSKVLLNTSKETAAHSAYAYSWLCTATTAHCHLDHMVHLFKMSSLSLMATGQMDLSAVVTT